MSAVERSPLDEILAAADPLREAKDVDLIRAAEERGYVIHRPQPAVRPIIDLDIGRVKGERVRVAVISDTHFGSKYTQKTHLHNFLAYAKRRKVSAILHCGDLTDGPFRRHRNPHEVWLHSYDNTVDYVASEAALPKLGIPYKVISGNHDDWWLDDGGPDIVAAIAAQRSDFEYLGRVGAFVRVGPVTIELAHPNEGGAYALSYKLQKHVEGMPQGEKPDILCEGNYHKAAHLPDYRGVEGFLVPAYQSRTHWMHGKRLASVVGGMILEFGIGNRGLAPSLEVEWVIERVPLNDDWPGAR
jgi:predicted phosphodiesterase